MRKVITVLSLILIICANTNFAQNKLGFEFDYARFKLDENSVYLELYYDIREGDLTPVKGDNVFVIKGNLLIEITDKVKKEITYKKDFPFQDSFAEITDEVKAKNMVGVLGVSIPKGEYTLKLVVQDLNNRTNSKTVNENLTIAPFDEKNASISDIQLSLGIIREDANKSSIFYKSGLEVTPNPSMMFSNKLPVVYYYVELYNLLTDSQGKSYKLVKSLFNNAGKLVSSSSKPVSAKGNASIEIGSFNLSKYPTGNYTIELGLVDTLSKKAMVAAKKLYFYNTNIKAEEYTAAKTEYVGSEYSLMSEAECNKMLDQIKYIAERDELAQIDKLDTYEAKKQFLFTFWSSRNENKVSGINDSRTEFDMRVQYANKNYGYKYKEGYKTDRGRVLIKYGIPDDVERHPVEGNTSPYEIWTYNSVGKEPNVIFAFGDIGGFGNYLLLHSTKQDEPYDENYIKKLQKR